MRVFSIAALLSLFLASLVSAELVVPTSTWKNVDYTRKIDLSRSYVKEDHYLQIKNIAQEPSQIYYFSVPEELKDKIALFLVTAKKSSGKMALKTEELDDISDGLSFFKIQLPYPVAPKGTFDMVVSMIYLDAILPLPAVVSEIADKQTLVFNTNKLPCSVYPTSNYELSFRGFQGKVDELELHEAAPVKGSKYEGKNVKDMVIYGPFDLAKEAPLARLPMKLSYERITPLMYVNKLQRDVWVSHWSEALQVEEHYQLTNKGVALKNGFSRVDYVKKKMPNKVNPAINSIEIPLHDVDTEDIYYTDLVGNVSTSAVVENSLLLKPRYPIFGGWHYNFTIGWTNSLSKYLHTTSESPDEHVVRFPLFSGPRDCAYGELDFNVLLPAGSEVLDIQTPLNYDESVVSQHFSYLDTLKGHTKVSLRFENLVDDMRNIDAVIKYKYTKSDQFAQVISISLYILIALIGYIAVKAIDIRINNATTIRVNKKDL